MALWCLGRFGRGKLDFEGFSWLKNRMQAWVVSGGCPFGSKGRVGKRFVGYR